MILVPDPGVQKIYNNFDIISNNVESNSFIYEIVGDSYDWSHLKASIEDINEDLTELEDVDNAFNYMFNFPLISSDASNINPFNYVFNIPLNKK